LVSSGAWITLPKDPPALLVAVGNILKYIVPALQQSNDLDPTGISRDEAEVKKYLNDPLVHDKITINFGAEMLPAAKWLETYKGPAKVPFLLMHGSEDRLTSHDGSVLMSNNLTGDVTMKSWNGFYHEIHNEPEQKEVFDYTINWLEEKITKWSDDTKED
jgi:alpha-beta hydrolase superfamily lysophospholipase